MKAFFFLTLLLILFVDQSLSQCSTSGGDSSAQTQLDNLKASVKVAKIVTPIVGGIVFIGLVTALIIVVKIVKRLLAVLSKIGIKLSIKMLLKLALGCGNIAQELENKTPQVELSANVNLDLSRDEEEGKEDKKKNDDKKINLKFDGLTFNFISRKDLKLRDEPLFSAGFRLVYRGEWNKKQVVAFRYPTIVTEEQQKAFHKEADRRQKLQFEFLARFLGAVVEEERFYFVTEYYERNLHEDLRKTSSGNDNSVKPLSDSELKKYIKILLEVASAIRFLHEQGTVHRDIAARNVMFDSEGHARLDFGSSTFVQDYKFGRQSAYIGPAAWMAPESLNKLEFTPHSDVFSFGVLIWEVFNRGADPFSSRSLIEVACPVIHKNLRLPIPENAPARFQKLMQACFEEDPDRRPTIVAVEDQLKEALQE